MNQRKKPQEKMAAKHHHPRNSSSISRPFRFSFSSIIAVIIIFSALYYYFFLSRSEPSWISSSEKNQFVGNLKHFKFPWNKLCFGPTSEKLRLAVFSKSWPTGSNPGGMERHAYTLYTSLAAKGHEIHVFTVPSDRRPDYQDRINQGNLRIYFAPNDHGTLNCSLAFEIFERINEIEPFDYVHTESVSLPQWRARKVNGGVAVTWHGIWYEIIHSKLFQELYSNSGGGAKNPELQDAIPKLVDEIRFFPSYNHHICISNSARDVLVNIYQLPRTRVHVILNGVDETKFVHSSESGSRFRSKHGVPEGNGSLVMGVSGRLVHDKGHPLLYEAFLQIAKRHPNVYLLVAGTGPWERRYLELGSNVKVLGALDPEELSDFYNAMDVLVNPTLRPQGLDLTIIEAMHCGKTVVAPNYPSIVGTVVVNEEFGYTFSPNVGSLVEALDAVVADGTRVLERKGRACKDFAASMFTATKMASAYERFFLCMKNDLYCQYPLPTDC